MELMEYQRGDLVRTLGRSTRVWAGAGNHEVADEYWFALTGDRDPAFNLACCWSASASLLVTHCLEPVLSAHEPALIMLADAALANAQTLIDAGWVNVGAMPFMMISETGERFDVSGAVRRLGREELDAARGLLADAMCIGRSSAAVALPDSALEHDDIEIYGQFEDDRLVAEVTVVRQDGFAVIWSMATWRDRQGRGHGRELLETVLREELGHGAHASLLSSTRAGEALYRRLGYVAVDHLQVWSRPRWVLGSS
ncbi:MAG: GNAT family N-acetyltransferase [Acidimicrobiales bacterium]